MKPNYYAVIPAEIRYDKDLKDKAKLLYGEIASLTQKNGECWATNNYFAELYGVSKMTISRLIQDLVDKGYISVEIRYKEGTKEIEGRYIKIGIYPYQQNCIYPIYKNVEDNNININNIKNNKKENIKRKTFIKPSIEEIEAYCIERNNCINAQVFYDYYETNGWVQGKNKPIRDWKACIRTWEQRAGKQIKKVIPEWFNNEPDFATPNDAIPEPDDDFKNFIEDFRK